jgi:hypothetical protein
LGFGGHGGNLRGNFHQVEMKFWFQFFGGRKALPPARQKLRIILPLHPPEKE